MIFAVLDLLRYRCRDGIYSDASIRSEGGSLATRENFSHPNRFKIGDLAFLHTADSFLSWLVMYYTSSVWSHTATFTENGYVVDATTGGVMEHPFADYLDGKSYIMVKTVKDISSEARQRMLAFLREQVGSGYNWFGVIQLLLHTIFGFHAGYRMHFSLDILLLLACLMPVWFISPVVGMVVAIAAATYVAIVIVATPWRYAMHFRMLRDGIRLPHCPKHIRTDKPNA